MSNLTTEIKEIAERYIGSGENITERRAGLSAAITALIDKVRDGEWLPIESGPEMRTVILFADTTSDNVPNWRMGTGFYHREMKIWIWEGEQVRDWAFPPTHWRPLPPPPSKEPTTMSSEKAKRCLMCRKEIVEVLCDVGPANDYLCLECSGATLEDFMEEGMTEEGEMDNHVHMMRTFHGKD